MGQTLRRATGNVRPGRPGRPEPPPPPAQRPSRPAAADPATAPSTDSLGRARSSDADVSATIKVESSVLEERDPKYDEMLGHMVGRITTRPGGKLEMGEAGIVERHTKPMPKLRGSRAEEVGTDLQKPLPPGTLSIVQIREIILLHQGKAEGHQGPMDVQGIAKKFGVDAMHVQQIIQFMSLPPEDGKRQTH